MAGDTYYYIFSVTLMVGAIVRFIGLATFRKSGKTLFGETLQQGSSRYEKLKKTSSTPSLAFTALLIAASLGSVVFEVGRLLHYHSSTAYLVLILMPVLCIAGFVAVFVRSYK